MSYPCQQQLPKHRHRDHEKPELERQACRRQERSDVSEKDLEVLDEESG